MTDEMVADHTIDGDEIDAFVPDAAIVIAHNAVFDRKFAERYWPVIANKHWVCWAHADPSGTPARRVAKAPDWRDW
jgi:DNA polymerase-3 subunit epsilon